MSRQQVPHRYIALLERLYSGQTGQVITDKESKTFPISRGTKQGDPISPKLFSAVLEDVMREVIDRWKSCGYGVRLGDEAADTLTNLRFADDILLIATSKEMLCSMISDLQQAAKLVGLNMHMGKTKILTNSYARHTERQEWCEVGGAKIEILASADSTKYLGRSLSLTDFHTTELEARIGAAWRCFLARKEELCNKKYPLQERLRLFEATVSKTALYGCECWTMSAADRSRLQTTQRKMLRWIVGISRWKSSSVAQSETSNSSDKHSSSSGSSDSETEGPTPWEENFVDWIQRATGLATWELRKANLEDWVTQQRRIYWRWAGHTCRRIDDRWAVKALRWTPTHGSRAVGHPKKRWIDDLFLYADRCDVDLDRKRLHYIIRHCGEATDGHGKRSVHLWRTWWKSHEDEFVKAL